MTKGIFGADGSLLDLSDDQRYIDLFPGDWIEVGDVPNGKSPALYGGKVSFVDAEEDDHLRRAISKKSAEVEQHREELFYTDFEYKGKVFQGRIGDVENLKEAVETSNTISIARAGGANIAEISINWRIKDNTSTTLLAIDLMSINLLLASKKSKIWNDSFIVKDQIKALTNVEDVDSFNIYTSWPASE